MNTDKLLALALRAHGPLYAALLRADIAIAKRMRTGVVPQAWRARRQKLARELDAAREQYKRELKRCRGEFRRGASIK